MPIQTYSKIGIVSNALVLCGEKPLQTPSDDRYGATVGLNLFEMIYENEIQSNRWRFSMKKGALSRLSGVPLNQWQYAYQLPSDMLLPTGMYPAKQPYEIYGDRIYTNASAVELDYQFKPELPALPAYFALLLAYACAKDMVKPLTESDSAVVVMERKYNRQRSTAQFADAQGRPAQQVFDSPFTDVRG